VAKASIQTFDIPPTPRGMLLRVTYGQSLNGTNYKVELNYPAATLAPSGSLRVFGDEPYQPVRFFFSRDSGRINHGFYEALAPATCARQRTCKTPLPVCLADAYHNTDAALAPVPPADAGALRNIFPLSSSCILDDCMVYVVCSAFHHPKSRTFLLKRHGKHGSA